LEPQACILLVATVLQACGSNWSEAATFLKECVHGADLSTEALRGAALALSSLTSDLPAIRSVLRRLRPMDSLREGLHSWEDVAPRGFDLVVANPPWEKLRASKHEVLAAAGLDRHYGDVYPELTAERTEQIREARVERAQYAEELRADLDLLGGGEVDLYKAFLELGARLARPNGRLAFLIPAGLIRSQGTEGLRRFLFEHATDLEMTVHDNRARHFAIDTRFKFLTLHATMGGARARRPLVLHHAAASDQRVERTGSVQLERSEIQRFRNDLAVPELRSPAEWTVLRQMMDAGTKFSDPSGTWQPQMAREVDMTADRPSFHGTAAPGRIPVIEGRMVHQFRYGVKAYRSGTGRSAVWEPVRLGSPEVRPQFWIDRGCLRRDVCALVHRSRVGFCDVTGQTNERSLLAARIPPGVVCGNKVPTITFGAAEGDPVREAQLGDLWLGVANSFAFDWMLRRVLTTSVNYFLLLQLPMPTLPLEQPLTQRLVRLSRSVSAIDQQPNPAVDLWEVARVRAEIDVLVLGSYGLDRAALKVILDDFPLTDRGQPPLPGESRATVTRDFLLQVYDDMFGAPPGLAHQRVWEARRRGAIPYVPSEHVPLARIDTSEEAPNGRVGGNTARAGVGRRGVRNMEAVR
jgi:hypothetical protein